jgi:hypothetical protein
MLQGVTLAPVEAIPTNGFVKSSVVKPTPLSIDLDAAWLGPSTNSFENFLFVIIPILI